MIKYKPNNTAQNLLERIGLSVSPIVRDAVDVVHQKKAGGTGSMKGTRLLWDSARKGTYVRARHGELG